MPNIIRRRKKLFNSNTKKDTKKEFRYQMLARKKNKTRKEMQSIIDRVNRLKN
jgi:hypothetical protein